MDENLRVQDPERHCELHERAVAYFEERLKKATGEKSERLRSDSWLYAVFDCATRPRIIPVQDPVRLGWEPIVIEYYRIDPSQLEVTG